MSDDEFHKSVELFRHQTLEKKREDARAKNGVATPPIIESITHDDDDEAATTTSASAALQKVDRLHAVEDGIAKAQAILGGLNNLHENVSAATQARTEVQLSGDEPPYYDVVKLRHDQLHAKFKC